MRKLIYRSLLRLKEAFGELLKGGSLCLTKVLKILFVILLLFVCSVSVRFLMKNNDAMQEQKIEQANVTLSPEQLKIDTMNILSQIVRELFVENIILDMEISSINHKQKIVLSLQGTEFIDETTLLKDSYNLLKEMQQLRALQEVTLKWFMNIDSKNTEAFTLTFDAKAVQNIQKLSYKDLPTTAKRYVKHDQVKISIK